MVDLIAPTEFENLTFVFNYKTQKWIDVPIERYRARKGDIIIIRNPETKKCESFLVLNKLKEKFNAVPLTTLIVDGRVVTDKGTRVFTDKGTYVFDATLNDLEKLKQ